MGKRLQVLLMLMLMLMLSRLVVGWKENAVSMENSKDRTSPAAGNAKQKAEQAMQTAGGAKEDTKAKNHWWGYGKFSQGYESNKEDRMDVARNLMDNAGDAKDFAYKKADQAINTASDKAGDANEKIEGAMAHGKDKAANAYDQTKDKFNMATGMASDKATEAKGAMEDKEGNAKKMVAAGMDKAANAYDEAKDKVGRAYKSAKDTMSDQAKTNYEVAKEKASQAAGDLGNKMRG